jgi:hypothetical protein
LELGHGGAIIYTQMPANGAGGAGGAAPLALRAVMLTSGAH